MQPSRKASGLLEEVVHPFSPISQPFGRQVDTYGIVCSCRPARTFACTARLLSTPQAYYWFPSSFDATCSVSQCHASSIFPAIHQLVVFFWRVPPSSSSMFQFRSQVIHRWAGVYTAFSTKGHRYLAVVRQWSLFVGLFGH